MNVVKSYFAHLIAYVGAAYVIVTKIDPSLLPPNVASVVTTWGPIVGAGLAAVHHVSLAPASPPVTVAKVHFLTVMAAVALAVSMLPGCASVQSFLGSPTGQTVVTAGVQVGVTTAEQKGVTAAQINSVAKAVLVADTGLTATVTTLTATVNSAAIKAGVPPGDIVAFQVLETAFDAYLVAKYGNNPTVATVQADVAAFCNAVIADTGG